MRFAKARSRCGEVGRAATLTADRTDRCPRKWIWDNRDGKCWNRLAEMSEACDNAIARNTDGQWYAVALCIMTHSAEPPDT